MQLLHSDANWQREARSVSAAETMPFFSVHESCGRLLIRCQKLIAKTGVDASAERKPSTCVCLDGPCLTCDSVLGQWILDRGSEVWDTALPGRCRAQLVSPQLILLKLCLRGRPLCPGGSGTRSLVEGLGFTKGQHPVAPATHIGSG